jgi:hypothetical protein
VAATGNRIIHVDSDIETMLSALESAGLVVVTRLVPIGPGAKTMGIFRVRCPRGCHGSVDIQNKILAPLVKQRFREWISEVLTAHDEADMRES